MSSHIGPVYFALAVEWTRDSAQALWIVAPSYLPVAATISKGWRLLTPVSVKARRDHRGLGRTPAPCLNSLGGEGPGVEEEVDVVAALAGLMTQTMTDSSSTISSPLASVDGYDLQLVKKSNNLPPHVFLRMVGILALVQKRGPPLQPQLPSAAPSSSLPCGVEKSSLKRLHGWKFCSCDSQEHYGQEATTSVAFSWS
ncbi:hypothetical protein GWK47_010254 [Chionoecetes opilio]|uniref:Uncharacterized protein n=1 Tax=Chionoecetes opilio TaxID=41210 RepID=A0A8J4Y2L1_CHIOP|nr:hypothetical protein GWK47_010254 [Chionoecetes opilio]